MSRKLIAGLAVALGLTALVGGLVVRSIPAPVTTTEDGTHTVEIAMLVVPIFDPEPLVEAPDQFLGIPHPRPDFDVGKLGPDLTFQQDAGDLEQLDTDEVLRAVYLGHDAHGQPYYIWHSSAQDLRRMIGQIIADFGSFGRLETSYGTEAVGDGLFDGSVNQEIAQRGMTTGSITSSGDGTTFTAEWHALPEDVAAVVLHQGGQAVGWQRPVSGTAAFHFHYDDISDPETIAHDTVLVALTADGDEWNRYVVFPR